MEINTLASEDKIKKRTIDQTEDVDMEDLQLRKKGKTQEIKEE